MNLTTRAALALIVLYPAAAGAQPPSEFVRYPSYEDRVRAEGPVVTLSLHDTVTRALSANLDIRISNLDRLLSDQRVISAQGYYDPTFSVTTDLSGSHTPTASLLQGTATEAARASAFAPSLQQNVPGGGSIAAKFGSTRNTTNNAYTFINPLFGSNINVSVTQPLWRGFLHSPADRQIGMSRLDDRIVDSQFQTQVASVIEATRNQYWELVGAIQDYETRRQSMDLAITQYENTGQRVQVGLLTPVALTSSRAEVASREQELIRSEVQIISAQNALKRLIASDPMAEVWAATLLPSDRPDMQEVTVTAAEAVTTALKRRPELDVVRLQLEQNDIDRRFSKNATKPAVNLQANLSSIGHAGTVFVPGNIFGGDSGAGPTIDPTNPAFGALSRSWSQALAFDYPSWSLGVSVQMPLRNRAAAAEWIEAQISRQRIESVLHQTEQAIVVEVRNAYESIATYKKSLQAARLAAELSQQQLASQTARFQVGFTTDFEVLRYQRDLAEARLRELRASIDYQIALTALERAMHVIVDDETLGIARRAWDNQ